MRFSCPILIICWKRHEKVQNLIKKIKIIKPSKLYIFCDGPNDDYICEEAVIKTRKILDESINWDCDIHKNYQSKNLGCKNGVSTAINWLFDNESKGIILEEDCLPEPSFFAFTEQMLEKFYENKKIFMITGNNFLNESIKKTNTFYFTKYPFIWGWATWRDRWEHFDKDIIFWPKLKKSKLWKNIHSNLIERIYWENLIQKCYLGKIDTWDAQWAACVWKNNGITVSPKLNLVSNDGFDKEATHTKDSNSNLSKLPTNELRNFISPKELKVDQKLDHKTFYKVFFNITLEKLLLIIIRLLKNCFKTIYSKIKIFKYL